MLEAKASSDRPESFLQSLHSLHSELVAIWSRPAFWPGRSRTSIPENFKNRLWLSVKKSFSFVIQIIVYMNVDGVDGDGRRDHSLSNEQKYQFLKKGISQNFT